MLRKFEHLNTTTIKVSYICLDVFLTDLILSILSNKKTILEKLIIGDATEELKRKTFVFYKNMKI